MKRITVCILLLAVALALGAAPLTYLNGGFTKYPGGPVNGFATIDEKLFADFEKSHPGYKINSIMIDLSTGSTLTMDAMTASGMAPDVYQDFGGRVGKYMVPEFALDLKPYLADWLDFVPAQLALVTKNGKIMALPFNSWANGFAVNTDMLASVGYKLPPVSQWTTDEYLRLAAKLKASGKYVHYLFAKNQSSDQWWMPWFYAFGAVQFAPGDYSKTRINSPQAVKALNYLKGMVDAGYVPADPGALDDDMALEAWATEKVATLSMQVGHAGPAIKSAVDQKAIDKPFNYMFTELPHAPGLAHTPISAGPTFAVVHKTADAARNKAAAELALLTTGKEMTQVVSAVTGGFPALLSVKGNADARWNEINGLLRTAGVMDLGIVLPQFSAIRAQLFPLMQEFYAGRMTATEVLKECEARVNAILAGK
jgi:ABC-type glycerol-3-phosphate transport system substrate-binding protein